MTRPGPLLQAVAIAKSFGGLRALRGVSFDVLGGEVHALVGENGAGKSTLIRIMTGADTPDSGLLVVGGRRMTALDPAIARARGIAAVYQQPSMFPDLTVAENIAMSLERGTVWRRVRWPARLAQARALLDRAGGTSIDPERLASTLTLPEQQLVEIARAIGSEARVVVMDESTASLGHMEVRRLFETVTALRAAGAGVVYISHRLDEVFEIANRVTVLRDGATVATRPIDAVSRSELIAMMVGRETPTAPASRRKMFGAPALELIGVASRAGRVRDVSLSIRAGEIVGLAGLAGSGRSELAEAIFGLTPIDGGEVRVRGVAARIDSPAAAIARGIGYVPKDRRQHGVVPELSVARNATMASLGAISTAGLVRTAAERGAAVRYIDRLAIRTPSPATPVEALSGGNQQKVALARWLMTDAHVLVLDEPTQGVDVGAKAEIHRLLADLAARGVAIVMISAELPELLGLCDRIAVMRSGTICGELPATASPAAVIEMAVGP